MASRLKNVVRTLNAKAYAKAPARPQLSEAERSAASIIYAASIGDKVDPDALAEAHRLMPPPVAVPFEIPERLRITDDMPAREAAARYAELIEWLPR